MRLAAADPAAQLVELGEAEALGVLDDHQRGVGDVDADLDHRRRDQHRRPRRAGRRPSPRPSPGPFIRPWTTPTLSPKRSCSTRARSSAAARSLASLSSTKRADPIGLPARGEMAAEAVDHLAPAARR